MSFWTRVKNMICPERLQLIQANYIYDAVERQYVHLYVDKAGRKWMAFSSRARFRVEAKDK